MGLVQSTASACVSYRPVSQTDLPPISQSNANDSADLFTAPGMTNYPPDRKGGRPLPVRASPADANPVPKPVLTQGNRTSGHKQTCQRAVCRSPSFPSGVEIAFRSIHSDQSMPSRTMACIFSVVTLSHTRWYARFASNTLLAQKKQTQKETTFRCRSLAYFSNIHHAIASPFVHQSGRARRGIPPGHGHRFRRGTTGRTANFRFPGGG